MMLTSYFRIIYRKLMREKAFAAINMIGLSISLAAALLIYMYVSHELSYDRFHKKADRIYRVYCAYADAGEAVREFAYTAAILSPTIREEVPEIEDAVRAFSIGGNVVIQSGDCAISRGSKGRRHQKGVGLHKVSTL